MITNFANGANWTNDSAQRGLRAINPHIPPETTRGGDCAGVGILLCWGRECGWWAGTAMDQAQGEDDYGTGRSFAGR